jgi:tetratricopeptide (TPR) repeat protein
VEGSVRKAGDRVRVTAQLLDASTGAHVWAETYERQLVPENLFAVQDEITNQVVSRIGDTHGAVNMAAIQKVRTKSDASLDDYECVLRTYEYQRFLTPDKHAAVKTCLTRTVERNPGYAEAWANLAYTYVDQYWTGYEGPPDPLDRAYAAARKAVELDHNSQRAHFSLANTYFFQKDLDRFFLEADKALALNPNNTEIVAALGVRFTYAEKRERGVALIEKAIRLNPAHPGWYWLPVAFHHVRNNDYQTALNFARMVDMPGFWPSHLWLAAIYGQLGDEDGARVAVSELNALNPNYKDNPEKFLRMWFKSDEAVDQFLNGLEKAGMFD